MSRPGGAVTVRAARNASRPRATVPGTKPPGIRAREGHLQSATHSCVTYGPYVTQNRKEGPHMSYQEHVTSRRSAASRTGVPSSSVTRSARWAARPGGRLLRAAEPFFGRWFPGALRIRSRVLRRLPGRGFLARRFLLFGVQFLGHRQRPHLGIVPPCPRPPAVDRLGLTNNPRIKHCRASHLAACGHTVLPKIGPVIALRRRTDY